jgi:RND family efflux transporter MFP subunit
MRKFVWIGAAALVAIGAALAASQRGGEAKPSAAPAPAALEFAAQEVVQPVRVRLPGWVEFSGALVAPQTAIVRAKAAGTLLSLAVAEGSRVRAGQVLAQIDMADLASRIAERRANLASARAALVQAEQTHASNQSLAAQHFISPIALENSRAALDTAQANLNAVQAALDTTQVALRDATVLAPISGIVAKRFALPGEKVSPEQQLLTIVDLAQLELAGSVGTHEVARLRPGQPVQVQVEGLEPGERPLGARIARISPAADPGTRSIGVAVALPNPGERLRAGQYALARVALPDDTPRLTVPDSAVSSSSGQDHVWVIENGSLARRAVTLGRRDPGAGRVEVLQGLNTDSVVLAARFDNLREGAKARVAASRPAAVAATSDPVLTVSK